jgi:hypothetical protein
MSTNRHIRYVPRHDIDTTRWDTCIDQAANSLLYGFHFYLDHMTSGKWDALILGDYEAVMPLPWRRKYGIRYCYQPPFTQQTGIFSAQPLSKEIIDTFLQTTRDHFRFAELFLNYGNAHPTLQPRTNYTLSLDAPYEHIAKGYKKILLYSLKLATRASLVYTTDIDLDTALAANAREYAARTPHVTKTDRVHFQALCTILQNRGQLVLRAAAGPDKQLLATALLFRDPHRLYLLQSTTPKAGRKVEANRFLLDAIIREFATQSLMLDFEGSEIPGVAQFYANFGGTRQPYFFYRHNRLPWPLNLLKG